MGRTKRTISVPKTINYCEVVHCTCKRTKLRFIWVELGFPTEQYRVGLYLCEEHDLPGRARLRS